MTDEEKRERYRKGYRDAALLSPEGRDLFDLLGQVIEKLDWIIAKLERRDG